MATRILHALFGATVVVGSLHAQDKPKPVQYYNPVWSPDSRTVLFESTRDGKFAVCTINADGSNLTRLTPATFNNEQPTFSPDGKRIVFSSDRDDRHLDLYVMYRDGSNPARLTTTPAGGYYNARFSPDGRWISYQGRPDNAEISDQIYVMRADGSGQGALTDKTTLSMSPRWTPDSQWITFVQQPIIVRLWKDLDPPGKQKMEAAEKRMAIHPDGTGLRPLTPAEIARATARRALPDGTSVPEQKVSPDGRAAVYEKKFGDQNGIAVFEFATGQERKLIAGGTN